MFTKSWWCGLERLARRLHDIAKAVRYVPAVSSVTASCLADLVQWGTVSIVYEKTDETR